MREIVLKIFGRFPLFHFFSPILKGSVKRVIQILFNSEKDILLAKYGDLLDNNNIKSNLKDRNGY